MANYPSLSKNPSYPLDEAREDAVIRSSSEAGYETTRPRFTKARRSFSVKYDLLPSADKSTLDTFYETTLGSGAAIFVWSHPETSTSYNVRFKQPIKYTLARLGYYNAAFELVEV